MPLGAARFGLQAGDTTVEVSYLVLAGGAGGGFDGGGGGGAGGYRNSFSTETSGRNSSTETPLTLDKNTTYSRPHRRHLLKLL